MRFSLNQNTRGLRPSSKGDPAAKHPEGVRCALKTGGAGASPSFQDRVAGARAIVNAKGIVKIPRLPVPNCPTADRTLKLDSIGQVICGVSRSPIDSELRDGDGNRVRFSEASYDV